MISVNRALEIIKETSAPLMVSELIPVEESLNRVLSETIIAPLSMPPFRQSAMDGYALHLHEDHSYKVIGEVQAGDDLMPDLKAGEAIRIFTGGLVPDSADAVVMQEKVTVEDSMIKLKSNPPKGSHLREVGEQLLAGSESLLKGTRLTPAGIALLKSMGITKVKVSKLPRVSVMVTGNELMEAGKPLQKGKIYESNSSMMETALRQRKISVSNVLRVKDSLEDTEAAMRELMKDSDVIFISGGVSVGDYDFVGKASNNLGITQHFYRIKQKPGKPMLYGKGNNTYILGLPGNPASTLTCLYVYGFTLLDILTGAEQTGLTRIKLPISEDIVNPYGRALFLKAKTDRMGVTPLRLQQSSAILSMAIANALIYIPEDVTQLKKGAHATCLLLP